MALDPTDGGYSSRKMIMSYAAMGLISGGSLVCAHWPAFGANYPTLVGGILGALTVYCGVNVANSFVASKHLQGIGETPAIPEVPETPPTPETPAAPK